MIVERMLEYLVIDSIIKKEGLQHQNKHLHDRFSELQQEFKNEYKPKNSESIEKKNQAGRKTEMVG